MRREIEIFFTGNTYSLEIFRFDLIYIWIEKLRSAIYFDLSCDFFLMKYLITDILY